MAGPNSMNLLMFTVDGRVSMHVCSNFDLIQNGRLGVALYLNLEILASECVGGGS